ncbi:MAG: nucleotidyltransferase [Bacteroidetes bacterium 41-46]|nr:MAG: nucleotidyltransferase [Bacteroidetes bacterium 41-46]
MRDYTKNIIYKNANSLEALHKLNVEKSSQTLFVLDDNNRLIGTLTDGDIRRGLIKGLDLNCSVHQFSFKNFMFIENEINVSDIKRLKQDGIKILPKLNSFGQIEKVYDLTQLNSILPLHAVIMAGGRGERLRPLTDQTPKPMLPLGLKPILEHNIDRLISFGVETITITVRYLAEQIIDYFGDGSSKGINIDYIKEETPLGTIGALSLIEDIKQESVLVLNSDIFSNINFEDLFLVFENSNADMAVASIPYSVDIPYAIMELEGNTIKSFKEKPKNTYYANAGIYLIKKQTVNIIPRGRFFNATDLMNSIISNNGRLIHSPITGYWIDIGKHDDYNKAKEIIKHL